MTAEHRNAKPQKYSSPRLEERRTRRRGEGEEQELGDQLVLGQTLDELSPPRNARLAQVDQEKERVERAGEERPSRS